MNKKNRRNLILWYAGAFLMPPMAWLGLAWFAQIWTFNEMLQIVLSLNIWIYVMVYMSLSLTFLFFKLRFLTKFELDQSSAKIKKVSRVVNGLPGFFSINIIMYILIGPFVVLHGMTFLTKTEFYLAEAVGVPIIFLFAAPFYVQFLANIEKATKDFPRLISGFFFRIRGKLTMTLGFTNVGIIALVALTGISLVNSNPDHTSSQIFSNLVTKNLIGGVLALSIQLTNIFLIIRMVNKPIKNLDITLDTMLKDIDQGVADLTVKIDRSTLDEIGTITSKFQLLVKSIKSLINNIKNNASKLNYSSEELTMNSDKLSKQASNMNEQSSQVASASEQMDQTMNTMASTTEEMSMNISLVATAAGEMTQNFESLKESVENVSTSMDTVSSSANDSFQISENAEDLAQKANSTMEILHVAADEIGTVSDMIKRIAEKTNLLALNATIEAASAGDAGKGFAVVAFEIKELANQSATAAEDITKRIEGVQFNTKNTNEAIVALSEIITKISTSSEEIKDSVKIQAKTLETISINIGEASHGIKNIARSANELTSGSNELSNNAQETSNGISNISKNIATINETLNENKENTNQLGISSSELYSISEDLSESISSFLIDQAEGAISNKNTLVEIRQIENIITAHIVKGEKIEKMLEGGPVVLPMDSHHCSFAKWYYAEGTKKWKNVPEFKEIEEPHEKIHTLMNDIYNLYQAKKINEAREELKNWKIISEELKIATDNFVKAIAG